MQVEQPGVQPSFRVQSKFTGVCVAGLCGDFFLLLCVFLSIWVLVQQM